MGFEVVDELVEIVGKVVLVEGFCVNPNKPWSVSALLRPHQHALTRVKINDVQMSEPF